MFPWLEPIKQHFQRAYTGHAWLVYGDQGLGKSDLVAQIAAQILCHHTKIGEQQDRCGYCASCRLSDTAGHSDFYCIKPEKGVIQIDAIRKLISHLNLSPQISDCKIAVVEDAHRLNLAAANALLKILEEPPGETIIFLVTHQPYALLATIRSRCQRLYVPAPDNSTLLATYQESGLTETMPLKLRVHLDGSFRETLAQQIQQLLSPPVILPEMTTDQLVVLIRVLQWLLLDALKAQLNLPESCYHLPFFRDKSSTISQLSSEKVQCCYSELSQLLHMGSLQIPHRLRLCFAACVVNWHPFSGD